MNDTIPGTIPLVARVNGDPGDDPDSSGSSGFGSNSFRPQNHGEKGKANETTESSSSTSSGSETDTIGGSTGFRRAKTRQPRFLSRLNRRQARADKEASKKMRQKLSLRKAQFVRLYETLCHQVTSSEKVDALFDLFIE